LRKRIRKRKRRGGLSFASSSTLARQIEAGAPADLFISADQKWMDYAVEKKRLIPPRATAGQQPGGCGAESQRAGRDTINDKTDWTSLLKGGRLAVGEPCRQASMPKKRCKNWVPGRRCRRSWRRRKTCAARWRWLSNEAPLGIVYGSDAVASKGVKVVGTFPEDSHKKVEYPLAIVDGHKNATVSGFMTT
jgi:molybdate transport system substrate-binding protein